MTEIHLLESGSQVASRIDPTTWSAWPGSCPSSPLRSGRRAHEGCGVPARHLQAVLRTTPGSMRSARRWTGWRRDSRSRAHRGLARVVAALRENPPRPAPCRPHLRALPGGRLRAQAAGNRQRLRSILLGVLDAYAGEIPLRLCLETSLADVLWPTVEPWGFLRTGPGDFEIPYREDRRGRFWSRRHSHLPGARRMSPRRSLREGPRAVPAPE
jgi:hypothetical protein